jgi:hypothetical protein
MIKCPNCGSTAQVKVTKEYWSKISNSQYVHYQCGCGCVFCIETMSHGIINGRWQVCPKESEE